MTILTHRPGALVGSDGFKSPTDWPESPLSQALTQPILLGLFLPIQAGGWSASTLPRTTDWSFDYNRDLVLAAEGFGFDLVFALSQWLPKGGYGGVFTGEALDSFVTTAALTGLTRRIILVSTIHILYGPWHPLHLAKYGATLDHISNSRWGINIVTGHRAAEHEAFGWSRIEHDRRYELAAEFIEVLQRLWSETENYSFSGQSSWKLKDAFVTPKPRLGRPLLVNATGSDAGIAFAARYSDIVFITSPAGSSFEDALPALPAHTARIKQAARDLGREVKTLLNPMVICRETERETLAYHDAIVAHADPIGSFQNLDSDAHAWRGRAGVDAPKRRAIGGNIEVIGTPEQVVEQFIQLKNAGVDGLQLSFYDFKPDLDFFGRRVLPLMEQAGLRKPVISTTDAAEPPAIGASGSGMTACNGHQRRGVMQSRRQFFIVLGLAVVCSLFGGPPQPVAAEPLTVRIGFANVGADNRQFSGGSSAAVAHSEHYLDQEFRDQPEIKIEWSFFKGAGPAVNEAFANNQLDFALQGDLPQIIGRANGLKTKILLASGAHAPIYLAVPTGSPVHKVADLRGKKVSIFRGTNNHLAAVKVLAGYGLQEKDVQVINMDTATTNAALTSRDIDAAFGNFPLAGLAEKNIAEIIYTTKGDNAAYERHSTLIAQEAFITAHPDVTQKIVSAIVRAARWSSDEANRDAFFDISSRSGFPASGYRFDFQGQDLKYRNSPLIDASIVESYRFQAKQAKEFALLRRNVEIDAWFDRSFLDRALKEQGLVGYWQEYGADGKPAAAGQ